jgi:hypothetical protein
MDTCAASRAPRPRACLTIDTEEHRAVAIQKLRPRCPLSRAKDIDDLEDEEPDKRLRTSTTPRIYADADNCGLDHNDNPALHEVTAAMTFSCLVVTPRARW